MAPYFCFIYGTTSPTSSILGKAMDCRHFDLIFTYENFVSKSVNFFTSSTYILPLLLRLCLLSFPLNSFFEGIQFKYADDMLERLTWLNFVESYLLIVKADWSLRTILYYTSTIFKYRCNVATYYCIAVLKPTRCHFVSIWSFRGAKGHNEWRDF